MIQSIHSSLPLERSTPPLFNEGAASTASRVAGVALAMILALSSFLFVPLEAALALTLGTGAIFCILCCGGDAPIPASGPMRRWYHPIAEVFPVIFSRRVQPVLNPGPRAPVGGVIHPNVAVVPQPQARPAFNPYPRQQEVFRGLRLDEPEYKGARGDISSSQAAYGQPINPRQNPRAPVGNRK